MKKWAAIVALTAICFGCLWFSWMAFVVSTATCCSGMSFWHTADLGQKALALGLILGPAAVGLLLGGLGAAIATNRIRL